MTPPVAVRSAKAPAPRAAATPTRRRPPSAKASRRSPANGSLLGNVIRSAAGQLSRTVSTERAPRPRRTTRSSGGHSPAARTARGARNHRRVSGPARGIGPATARKAATARAVALPAGVPAPALPRLRPSRVLSGLGALGLRTGRWIHDSPIVDRMLRGRFWIGLLGALLIGLVALNVSLLKLSAGAGRNAQEMQKLQLQNDRLVAKVTRLGSDERIAAGAERLGLAMPMPDSVHYLSIGSADARRAAKAIRAGSLVPTGFAPGTGAEFAPSAPAALPTPVAAPGTTPADTTGPTGATGTAGATGATGTTGTTGEAAPGTAGQPAGPQPATTAPAAAAPGSAGPTGAATPIAPTQQATGAPG